MRAANFVWLGISAAVAFVVFMIAYEVRHLEEVEAELTRALAAERETMHVLRAEWSYLNRPERLEALATKHLGLAPLAAQQMIPLDALPARRSAPASRELGHYVAAQEGVP